MGVRRMATGTAGRSRDMSFGALPRAVVVSMALLASGGVMVSRICRYGRRRVAVKAGASEARMETRAGRTEPVGIACRYGRLVAGGAIHPRKLRACDN